MHVVLVTSVSGFRIVLGAPHVHTVRLINKSSIRPDPCSIRLSNVAPTFFSLAPSSSSSAESLSHPQVNPFTMFSSLCDTLTLAPPSSLQMSEFLNQVILGNFFTTFIIYPWKTWENDLPCLINKTLRYLNSFAWVVITHSEGGRAQHKLRISLTSCQESRHSSHSSYARTKRAVVMTPTLLHSPPSMLAVAKSWSTAPQPERNLHWFYRIWGSPMGRGLRKSKTSEARHQGLRCRSLWTLLGCKGSPLGCCMMVKGNACAGQHGVGGPECVLKLLGYNVHCSGSGEKIMPQGWMWGSSWL